MAITRDRIEDFKDAIRRASLSPDCDESKVASILASFIIREPRGRSPFLNTALKTLGSVRDLEQFILKHQKDYLDSHRSTEKERDSIEREVTVFIKMCKEKIDVLKNSIAGEEESSKRWFSITFDTKNADAFAHKHGVVLIVSERLHSVTSRFDQLRAVRFQDVINRSMPRRKPNRVSIAVSRNLTASAIPFETSEVEKEPGPLKLQQHHLDRETHALQEELSSLLDAANTTETKMVEMSALNHLMATHVLQQSQQIELLYQQAVEATTNVELGNRELSQAIDRNKSSRIFIFLFLVVLTLSLLFLDWYS